MAAVKPAGPEPMIATSKVSIEMYNVQFSNYSLIAHCLFYYCTFVFPVDRGDLFVENRPL